MCITALQVSDHQQPWDTIGCGHQPNPTQPNPKFYLIKHIPFDIHCLGPIQKSRVRLASDLQERCDHQRPLGPTGKQAQFR